MTSKVASMDSDMEDRDGEEMLMEMGSAEVEKELP